MSIYGNIVDLLGRDCVDIKDGMRVANLNSQFYFNAIAEGLSVYCEENNITLTADMFTDDAIANIFDDLDYSINKQISDFAYDKIYEFAEKRLPKYLTK